MVKRYEVDECGGFYEDPTGDYMLHEEYAKALALIAEMHPYIKAIARLCEGGSGAQVELCGLVARAEELLK